MSGIKKIGLGILIVWITLIAYREIALPKVTLVNNSPYDLQVSQWKFDDIDIYDVDDHLASVRTIKNNETTSYYVSRSTYLSEEDLGFGVGWYINSKSRETNLTIWNKLEQEFALTNYANEQGHCRFKVTISDEVTVKPSGLDICWHKLVMVN